MARYDTLTIYLARQPKTELRLSFGELERILGRKLPASAERQRAFWSNNAANNVMTRAWLAAGFRSEQVDLSGQTVVFRKERDSAMAGFEDAPMPVDFGDDVASGSCPLFGWMKGTITFAPDLDLTEPADPKLGDLLDQIYGSPA